LFRFIMLFHSPHITVHHPHRGAVILCT